MDCKCPLGVIQNLATDCQHRLRVQGLPVHQDWRKALQQATRATTVWAPGWLHIPASHSQTQRVAQHSDSAPCQWIVDLGSFQKDQKCQVLLASAWHSNWAILMSRSRSDGDLDPTAFGCTYPPKTRIAAFANAGSHRAACGKQLAQG